jgi:hypothetical protein
MEIQSIIGLISGVFAIIGTAGGFVTWLASKNTQKMASSIERAINPLAFEIRTLNKTLETNAKEHEDFKVVLKEYDDCLGDHETRITVLEKTGGKK